MSVIAIDPQNVQLMSGTNASTAASAVTHLVDWWRSFDDRLLTSPVERALAKNLDLQQTVAHVSQVRAALKGANAALLPSGQITKQSGVQHRSLETPIGRFGSAFP